MHLFANLAFFIQPYKEGRLLEWLATQECHSNLHYGVESSSLNFSTKLFHHSVVLQNFTSVHEIDMCTCALNSTIEYEYKSGGIEETVVTEF